MGTAHKNWNLRLLAAFAALLLLAFVACGNQDSRGPGSSGPGGPQIGPDPGDAPSGGPPGDRKLPDRSHGDRTLGIWPQVWSQNAPGVQSWEYKVNCNDDPECFLSDLTSVIVTAPSGEQTELEKDFNVNEFSGEVTRRWVRYGPGGGNLPERGDYVFSYWRGDELAYQQSVPYDSDAISYPTDVKWRRSGADIAVDWSPPVEATKGMYYKAIIWQVGDTPELFISQQFDWDDDSGVLRNVPLLEGGKYSLNVAIFFDDGYAYSDYIIFEWPGVPPPRPE